MDRLKIIDVIIDNLPDEYASDNRIISKIPKHKLEHILFLRPNNIRLTFTGCRLLGKLAKSYSFSYTQFLCSKHLIALSVFTYPYYFSCKSLVLFSEEDALILQLYGGNVLLFLEYMYELRSNN